MFANLNLLYCVLAYRMDLISSAEVQRAIKAWGSRKKEFFFFSIVEILSEQGALCATSRAILEHAAQQQIASTGDDVDRSLEAVGSTVAELSDVLSSSEDDEIRDLLKYAHAWAATVVSVSPQEANQQSANPVAGRYQKIEPHAKGGLGEVFRAVDSELHREVALKEIQDRFAHNQECCDRFELEATLTGSLEHPSIVPVYGLGRYADGRPYYAMKFIKGESLSRAIKELHLKGQVTFGKSRLHPECRKLLMRFVNVCQAIDYAHSRGVIHRDLKPSNVMLGPHGETLVVDWGLAKRIVPDAQQDSSFGSVPAHLFDDRTQTQAGSTVGTPAFMSPEQARGEIDKLGPATDIFGLGAMLYTILIGHAPYDSSEKRESFYEKVRTASYPPPRSLNSSIPRALEAICLKAMAFDSKQRYSSAKQLAADIEAYLADETINAYSESWIEKVAREFRRDVGSAILVSILTAFAIQFVVFSALKNVSPATFEQISSSVYKYSAAIRFAIVVGSFAGFLRSRLEKQKSLATTARHMILYAIVFTLLILAACMYLEHLREWFASVMQQGTSGGDWSE